MLYSQNWLSLNIIFSNLVFSKFYILKFDILKILYSQNWLSLNIIFSNLVFSKFYILKFDILKILYSQIRYSQNFIFLTLRWHTGVKKTPGMFNLNFSPFNISKWFIHGPVILARYPLQLLKKCNFSPFFNFYNLFCIFKINFALNSPQHSLKWLFKSV